MAAVVVAAPGLPWLDRTVSWRHQGVAPVAVVGEQHQVLRCPERHGDEAATEFVLGVEQGVGVGEPQRPSPRPDGRSAVGVDAVVGHHVDHAPVGVLRPSQNMVPGPDQDAVVLQLLDPGE